MGPWRLSYAISLAAYFFGDVKTGDEIIAAISSESAGIKMPHASTLRVQLSCGSHWQSFVFVCGCSLLLWTLDPVKQFKETWKAIGD